MSHKTPHEKYMQAAQMENEPQDAPNLDDEAALSQGMPEMPNMEAICKEQVCPACDVKAEADQTRMRALAEMDNFKKRLTREHEEQMRYAAEKVLADLLPTLDNLDLALQYGTQHDECKNMLTGVEMTRKLLLDALKQHGLEPVGELGEPFTPELHEALTFDVRPDMEEGSVSQVFQRGYKLKERLLRPAKVSVSKLPD